MKRFVSISLILLSIICVSFMTERQALGFTGYVDPGSGLLALQCITSIFAAVGYFMRRRIAALFGSKKVKPELSQARATVQDTPLKDA